MDECRSPLLLRSDSERLVPFIPFPFLSSHNCSMGFCGRVWCNYHDPIGLLTMPIVLKGRGVVMVGISSDRVRYCLHHLWSRVLCVWLVCGGHPLVFDRSLLYLHGRMVRSQSHLYGSRTRRRSHRMESEDVVTFRLFRRRRRSTTNKKNRTIIVCRFSREPFLQKV